MKWIKILPDGRGGYNIFKDWTTGHELAGKILPLILLLPVLLVIGLVFPGLMWLWGPTELDKKLLPNTVNGLILSALTLLDFSFGGPVWTIVNNSETPDSGVVYAYMFFGTLNLMFLFGNTIILTLYYNKIVVAPKVLLVLQIIFVYFFYDIFNNVANYIYSDNLCFWMQAWIDYGKATIN